FIPQRQLDEARHLGGQNGLGLLDHVCIHAPTNGYGTEDVAALADPHFRPLFARGRAHCVDQGGEANTSMAVTKLFELLQEFVHAMYTKVSLKPLTLPLSQWERGKRRHIIGEDAPVPTQSRRRAH